MMKIASLMNFGLALTLSPLLLGIINRTKAFFAGRKGPPLLQLYFDLAKLLKKGAVYSRTTTWVFRAGPVAGLAAMLAAAALVPLAGAPALFSFSGDLVLFAYLLGLLRFLTVLSALDTGSSFEGMGASREVTFSALAEPALFLGLAALAKETQALSLSDIFSSLTLGVWAHAGASLGLAGAAIFMIFLTENARIPVDDPNTHLELTMIHEVMVLDHGGPDLAFIFYTAAIKLWVLGALLVDVLLPVWKGNFWMGEAAALAAMTGVAVLTGVIESEVARLRLKRVPQWLIGATALSALALILVLKASS